MSASVVIPFAIFVIVIADYQLFTFKNVVLDESDLLVLCVVFQFAFLYGTYCAPRLTGLAVFLFHDPVNVIICGKILYLRAMFQQLTRLGSTSASPYIELPIGRNSFFLSLEHIINMGRNAIHTALCFRVYAFHSASGKSLSHTDQHTE